ncbi:MAG: Mor transcription activator family protein [Syntrophales bacterium]
MERWLDKIAPQITIETLPESYQEVARIVGVDNAIKLSQYLGGLVYYFPQLESLLRKYRDELIRSEFTGANHRDLAKKYGLTEVWIREIVHSKTAQDQPDLFSNLSK